MMSVRLFSACVELKKNIHAKFAAVMDSHDTKTWSGGEKHFDIKSLQNVIVLPSVAVLPKICRVVGLQETMWHLIVF